ncbi:MAG TPA: type II toxin-antitoxin system PemK/MazF family toxin [Pirellulales bacterium]
MIRGDVVLVRFPHPSGVRGKKRPAVVLQADSYNQRLRTVVVAEVTKNVSMANDPACLYIDVTTPEGQATGLLNNSVISCLLLATIDADRVHQVLGRISGAMQKRLDDGIRSALGVQ